MSFKSKHSFQHRLDESSRIVAKYPDRIPVICEKKPGNTPDIDKNKYLVPNDLTVGQFIYVLRKHIKITSVEALYLFVNGTIPPTSELIRNVYTHHCDQDGFLYVMYACENTFGQQSIDALIEYMLENGLNK